MKFIETPLEDTWVIDLDVIEDVRGWFARSYDERAARAHEMDPAVIQCNISFNRRRDTLRGMHYQIEPYGEPKLIRCVRGAIFDVGIDLRPRSRSYCKWYGVELSADNRRAFYLPPGFAHGFQTLTDDTEIHYQMGAAYEPEATRGVRWDDPLFGITWPEPAGERLISERDRSYPDYVRLPNPEEELEREIALEELGLVYDEGQFELRDDDPFDPRRG